MKRTYFAAKNADTPAHGRFNLGSLLYEFDNPEALVEGFERIPIPPATDDSSAMGRTITVTKGVEHSVVDSSNGSAGLLVQFLHLLKAKMSLAKSQEHLVTSAAATVTNERFIPSRAYLDDIFNQTAVQDYLRDCRVMLANRKLYLVTGARWAIQGASGRTSDSTTRSGEASLKTDAATDGTIEGEAALSMNQNNTGSSSYTGSSPVLLAWRVHTVHYCRRKKKAVAKQSEGQLYSSDAVSDSDSNDESAEDSVDYEFAYDAAEELLLADIAHEMEGRECIQVEDDHDEQADVILARDQ